MNALVASASDIGRHRSHNEDSYLVDPALGLYVVCDGMGGHAAGDLASSTAIHTVQQHVREHEALLGQVARRERPVDDVATMLRDAVELASSTIYRMGQADRNKRGMGTTCTALLVVGTQGVMAHVGDSRLYLQRQGQLHQLSDDHTFLQEALRAGMLTPEQAKVSDHANLVTRAVGPMERVIVDTLVFEVVHDDALLLCSDGLHTYFDDSREIAALLSAPSLESSVQRFVELANARGGADNITAVTLRLVADAASPQAEKRSNEVSQTFDTLRHVTLFEEFTMAELVRVANVCREVTLPEHAWVIHEGDTQETLFLILHGAVEVLRGNTRLAELGRGSHFGEMALLNQRPRTASVRTVEPTRLLALDRQDLATLLAQEPTIASKFLWRLAQTLSHRLDDFYAYHEHAQRASKLTLPYGLHPSPFRSPGEPA